MNDWISANGDLFDGEIDFATAVESGVDSDLWNPALTVDLLHPNPAGMKVMADAIPLGLFR